MRSTFAPRTRTESFHASHLVSMLSLGVLSATRLASLATGRGGAPTPEEWPFVLLVLGVVAYLGMRLLPQFGLTRVEALLLTGLAPLLVLVDAPLGHVAPNVALAANLAGCVVPMAVGLKIFLERRVPFAEGLLVIAIGIVASFAASTVVPSRGVLLQYRIPAIIVGVIAAALLYRRAESAGAAGFAAGGLGVVIGADLLRLEELASAGGAGRIILGGAGLMDGIFLVAVLGAIIGETMAVLIRNFVGLRTPARRAA